MASTGVDKAATEPQQRHTAPAPDAVPGEPIASSAGQEYEKIGKSELAVHLVDQPFTWQNWSQKINWISFVPLVVVPIIGLLGAVFTPLQGKTLILAVVWYFLTGLGITAGYHRLWAHRAYSARLPLRIFFMLCGSGAFEGSIRWWSRDHRSHHRYTDTERDPYSVRKGFWYSHILWMLLKQNPKARGRCDISDLNADPVVVFQHRNFLKLAFTMALIFPTVVAGLGWGDWIGGYVYAGILRLVVVHHATFCVNSLAHFLGEQPFDDSQSPRDHVLTAFATLGEGYHNFHHSFPNDYRNALLWYQYDPTKYLIILCRFLGLAYDLKTFPSNEIEKGLVQQKQKKLDRWRSRLNWGIPLASLPVMEFEDFKEQAKTRPLILIAGVVHDMTGFDHPGGQSLIKAYVSRDATAAFNGGVYNHSNGAHNLLSNYRVAVVRGGMEVEIWKRGGAGSSSGKELHVDGNGEHIVRANAQPSRVTRPLEAALAS